MPTKPILSHEELAVMLATALRVLLHGGGSESSRAHAKAALERYDYDRYRRNWPDSETELRR